MGLEIERRFLVKQDQWQDQGEAAEYLQGYMSVEPERTVRVRIIGEQAWLTIKSQISSVSRYEFEYAIPVADARTMLNKLCPMVVSKTRYRVRYQDKIWEVDRFYDQNQGLMLAEIELQSENEAFEKPLWLGDEVTVDGRYTNAYLSNHPYQTWPEASLL